MNTTKSMTLLVITSLPQPKGIQRLAFDALEVFVTVTVDPTTG